MTQANAQTRPIAVAPISSPTEVAEGIFVFRGTSAVASAANQARRANITLLAGPRGALAWNTGVSHRHGQRLALEMLRHIKVPIRAAVVSHAYQDVLFGWSAFSELGIEVVMHEGAVQMMHKRCQACLERLTQMLGPELMLGTRLASPTRTINGPISVQSIGRELNILDLGHSSGPNDLMLFDPHTGTLLSGATVMTDTVIEIRDGDITRWIEVLESLAALPIKRVVPDYGAVSDSKAIHTTLAYLRRLQDRVSGLLKQGVTLADAVENAQMPEFANWPAYTEHHGRNVHQLYLQMESRFFE